MALAPRLIALQGIGSTPLQIALQGLLPVDQAVRREPVGSGGGGTGSHVSMSDWLRRFQTDPSEQEQLAAVAAAAVLKKAMRRRRVEEEMLFILGRP